MEDLYMKVLERLCKNGRSHDNDISDIFNGYFTSPERIEDQDDDEYSNTVYLIHLLANPRSEQICEFLNTMVKNKHITYENKSPKFLGCEEYKWEKVPVKFIAQVTKQGLDYYYNRSLQISTLEINSSNSKLIKSNLELNEAIKKNLKWQIGISIATVIVAALAAWFSYQRYKKPEPKMVELNKNIQLLSKGLEGIKTEVHNQKNLPISTVNSSHKH